MLELYACLIVPLSGLALLFALLGLRKARAVERTLASDVTELRDQILVLAGRVAAFDSQTPQTPSPQVQETPRLAVATSPPRSEPVPAARLSVMPDSTATQSVTGISPPSSSPSAPPSAPRPASPPAYARMTADLRENPIVSWFAGSHIVVRVGIIVLFFGVAFLLKFAADQGWLSIELRLIGAAVLGFVLVGFGWRLRRGEERRVYSLTLQGGGLGILYMTTFTAFRIYDLLPGWLAFGLLVLVSAATVALAVINDSRALAIIAVVGGFATPFLISTGEGSHIALLSYVAVINAVILTVAWFRSWRELNLVGFVFTVGVGVLWGTQAYTTRLFWSAEAFLGLFFLFYTGIAILYSYRRPTRLADPVDGLLVFGTPLVTATFQTVVLTDPAFRGSEYFMAWSWLAIGEFYLLAGVLLWRTKVENFGVLGQIFLGLGTLFVALAVPFAFNPHLTAAIWAAGGAGLVWLGVRYARFYYRAFGALIQLAAGGAIVFDWVWNGLSSAGTDGYTLAGAIVALAGLFSGYLFFSASDVSITERRRGEFVLTVWGLVWWFTWGARHVIWWADDVPLQRLGAVLNGETLPSVLLIFFALSSAASEWVGGRLRWRLIRFPALLLPVPAVGVIVLQIGERGHVLGGGGWLAWPVALAVYYWMLYRRDGDAWQRVYHAGGLWAIAFIGAVEGGWLAGRLAHGYELWTYIGWTVVPVVLVLAVSLLGRRATWPTGRHFKTYMALGLGPVEAALLLWIVWTSFRNSGVSSVQYVALLNPLGVAQLVILASTLVWLRRLGLTRNQLITGYAAIAGVSFLWLAAEMARTVHHYAAVPYRLDALFGSELLQTSYSIVWTGLALGLMFAAKQRSARWAWLIGAALLGITVLKLFLVDLSNTGTLARIISFLVVGVLMLIIGYLAPIPPRRNETAVLSQVEAMEDG